MELIGNDKYRVAKKDQINCSKCDRVFSSRDGCFYKDKGNFTNFRYECANCTEKIKAKIQYQIRKQIKIDSGAWMGSQERKALINYKKNLI